MCLPHFQKPNKAKSHSFYSLNISYIPLLLSVSTLLCLHCTLKRTGAVFHIWVTQSREHKIAIRRQMWVRWEPNRKGKSEKAWRYGRRAEQGVASLHWMGTWLIFIQVLKLNLENLGPFKKLVIFMGRHRCEIDLHDSNECWGCGSWKDVHIRDINSFI